MSSHRHAFAVFLCLSACTGGTPPEPIDTSPKATTDTDDGAVIVSRPDTAVEDTGDTDVPEPPPEPEVDCDNLPPLPANFEVLTGFGFAEDFDIDARGFHVSVLQRNLTAIDQAGNREIRATNVSSEASGTRILPDGAVVVNRVSQGSLVRVDPNGSKTVIVGDLSYPNGMEVDRDGFVYVAEQDGGRIRRIDPYTGDNWVIAENLEAPNGIIFGPNYQRLYFNSFGGGTVHVIEKVTETEYTEPVLIQYKPGGGGFDGLNVDECGNLYVTEFVVGKVWRVSPDGSQVEEAAQLPSSWIPNMRWGNDVGGFASDTLYVSDRDQGHLYGLQLGLKGKPPVFTP